MAWKNPPTNFKKTVEQDANTEGRRLASKVLRNLVVASPKDTGRFINNWLVNFTNPTRKILNGKDPSRSKALVRGNKKLKSHKDFASIYISNNLPYAKRLNEGHSTQAPANFVEMAIKKAVK